MSKKITTVYIDEDKVAVAKLKGLVISQLLDEKLDEVLDKADLLLERQKRLNIEKSINSQKMVEADKYGATV